MAKIKKFEDLQVWQMAFEFCQWLDGVVKNTDLSKDYKLKNQIESSSGSIMDNIAEGFERQGNREFINFLFIAEGSAGEARSQLYRLHMKHYIDSETRTEKVDFLNLLGKKLSSFIAYLKDTDHRGYHFKEDQEPYG